MGLNWDNWESDLKKSIKRKEDFFEINKSISHKYLRREGSRGNYKYIYKEEIKDANELKEKVHKLGYTFSRYVAHTGSEYIKVNGQQFRLADHEQPSSYQIRNYKNVKSLQEIYDIVSSKAFKYADVFIHEVNGKYFKDYEDEKHNIISKEVSKKEYEEIKKYREKNDFH